MPTSTDKLFIPPMEAEPTRSIPQGDQRQHEPKFDGYRGCGRDRVQQRDQWWALAAREVCEIAVE